MVLLTMTASLVEGIQKWRAHQTQQVPHATDKKTNPESQVEQDKPSLENPDLGKPISHGQIVDLWTDLRNAGYRKYSLQQLLRGSRVYVPPPPPKPEPTTEFKFLMACLRSEDERRQYEHMVNPFPPPLPPPTIARMSFSTQCHPSSPNQHTFSAVNRPASKADLGDDDVTYADVHRQLMLILNFVLSILGVAATLWVLARWWPTPARLFLAMGGAALVGIAEWAMYAGYVWHLMEARTKSTKTRETKTVVKTWVVGKETDKWGARKDATRGSCGDARKSNRNGDAVAGTKLTAEAGGLLSRRNL